MQQFTVYIEKKNAECTALAPECAAINIRRIAYGSVTAMFVSLAYIVIFLLTPPESAAEQQWHTGIITTHIIMLSVMGAAFLIALVLRSRKRHGAPEYVLQYVIIAVLMAVGITLTYFDQLVTPNITPYIILSLVVGAAFLIRPRVSLIIYAVSSTAFYFIAGLRPFLNNVVLSNRMNGIAVAFVGFIISLVMWRYNLQGARQRAHIQEQHKKLLDMANLDPLTGLYNRRKFDEIITQEVTLSGPLQRESSLIMLDIDFFKDINDNYGHPAGDSILVQFSRLLSGNIRKGDSICRVGGEEFIILLPGASEDEAIAVAENLRSLIENHTFTAGNDTVRLSASFGAARLDYNLDPTLISQYSKVDHALYIAKQNGRNRVIAAPPPGAISNKS